MLLSSRRNTPVLVAVAFLLLLAIHIRYQRANAPLPQFKLAHEVVHEYHSFRAGQTQFDWVHREELYPVNGSFVPAPKASSWTRIPRVQHSFRREKGEAQAIREERQSLVRQAFQRCWESYRVHAWLKDELTPLSGSYKNTFGGWAATLVDSLDTLWIMDLREEFEEAVEATMSIDFTNTTVKGISVFETNIRYLGGLLSAFDLSGDERLGLKALELAHVLYAAFDTPNRMPINDWDLQGAADGVPQVAPVTMVSAQIGSLSLEFTRLSQITGDPRWHDAVHRIGMHLMHQQNMTHLPGMWPVRVNPNEADFATGYQFSLGANADSLYEYLPKLHALLGGAGPYLEMYNYAMETAISNLLFRPMVPDDVDILFAGTISMDYYGNATLDPRPEHLVCFVGGMLALGGRLAKNQTHVDMGSKMADGCVWAYEQTPSGVMPETFEVVPCADASNCTWNESLWLDSTSYYAGLSREDSLEIVRASRLPRGISSITDRSYQLRPEAIESVFIMYRVTGDPVWMEKGWKMFESIIRLTQTDFANARVMDVTTLPPMREDSMESFWTAETLKYFYLLFSSPSLINLDEYVFNTEAHPLRRPR